MLHLISQQLFPFMGRKAVYYQFTWFIFEKVFMSRGKSSRTDEALQNQTDLCINQLIMKAMNRELFIQINVLSNASNFKAAWMTLLR